LLAPVALVKLALPRRALVAPVKVAPRLALAAREFTSLSRVAASSSVPPSDSQTQKGVTQVTPFSFLCAARSTSGRGVWQTERMRPLMRGFGMLWLGVVAFGCAAERRVISADAVERMEILPPHYRSLGHVGASCDGHEGFAAARGEPLASFDCSEERLLRVLAELAAESGGDVLAEVLCGADGLSLACRAHVGQRPDAERLARPLGEGAAATGFSSPAPSAAEVRRADEPRAGVAFAIEVDFEPRVSRFAGVRRAAEAVSWVATLPLSHVELGILRTRCDAGECALAELRHALRVAAGGLGASDVVGARCATLDEESWCVAEVAVAQADLIQTSSR
jgi:hypothetical protein